MCERRKILLQRVLAYYDIVQIVFVIYRYAGEGETRLRKAYSNALEMTVIMLIFQNSLARVLRWSTWETKKPRKHTLYILQ